jgi:hypothetical protein
MAAHRRCHLPFRGAANTLGFSVQLALARFPGWALQPGQPVPAALIITLAERLGVDPGALADYARERDTTRREHLAAIQLVFRFRLFRARDHRDLVAWLLPTALASHACHDTRCWKSPATPKIELTADTDEHVPSSKDPQAPP